MVRMHWTNKNLLFPEYRKRGALYLVYKMVRYCMFFQVLFYSVMGNYFYLGSMDHLMSKTAIVSATNKDSINIGRCTALYDVIRFNIGSWTIALYTIGLSYAVWMKAVDWDYTAIPDINNEDQLGALLFGGPATFMALMAFIIPLIMNPFVLGWPFNPPLWCCRPKKPTKKVNKMPASTRDLKSGGKVVDLNTFMSSDAASKLEKEAGRVQNRPDVELGSLATNDFGGGNAYPISVANPDQSPRVQGRRPQPGPIPVQSRNSSAHRTSQTKPTQADPNKGKVKLAMI